MYILENKKSILCPKCGRKVGTWDCKSTGTNLYVCHKCKAGVSFNGKTEETELKPYPQRTTSSGAVFY